MIVPSEISYFASFLSRAQKPARRNVGQGFHLLREHGVDGVQNLRFVPGAAKRHNVGGVNVNFGGLDLGGAVDELRNDFCDTLHVGFDELFSRRGHWDFVNVASEDLAQHTSLFGCFVFLRRSRVKRVRTLGFG